MGYLAVVGFSFVVTLVVVSVLLATLSHALFGVVAEWHLLAGLVTAFFAAFAAGYWYESPR